MSKSKGTYYEIQLVKSFTSKGYESWRVPMSGALGENPLVKVPDRVRKYLVGDICVSFNNNDVPIEVKYRANNPLSNVVCSLLTQYVFNVQGPSGIVDSTLRYRLLDTTSFIEHQLGNQVTFTNTNIKLPKQITDWIDQTDVLALKYYRSDWLFIVRI